jgi:hypothetical protein
MVYHFKNRVDTLEKNNEALADICQTLVSELEMVKMDVFKRSISKPPMESNSYMNNTNNHILSSLFQTMPNTDERAPFFIIKEGPVPDFEFEDEEEDDEEECDVLEDVIIQDNIVVEEVRNDDIKNIDFQSNELQSVFDDTISEFEHIDTGTKIKSKPYKKMNLAMLRTVAVNKGYSGSEQELWKLKKADILTWIEAKEKEEVKTEEE